MSLIALVASNRAIWFLRPSIVHNGSLEHNKPQVNKIIEQRSSISINEQPLLINCQHQHQVFHRQDIFGHWTKKGKNECPFLPVKYEIVHWDFLNEFD